LVGLNSLKIKRKMDGDFSHSFPNQRRKLDRISQFIRRDINEFNDRKNHVIPEMVLGFSVLSGYHTFRMICNLGSNNLPFKLNRGIAFMTPFLIGGISCIYPVFIDEKLQQLQKLKSYSDELNDEIETISQYNRRTEDIPSSIAHKIAILSLEYKKV
jgi:hypothetical protein